MFYLREKNLILLLSSDEAGNISYLDNLQKTTTALGMDFENDVLIHTIGMNEVFNWAGLNNFSDPLTLVFFGKGISGLDIQPNSTHLIGAHRVFETYTMSEIVSDSNKKAQFWLSFKSLFGK